MTKNSSKLKKIAKTEKLMSQGGGVWTPLPPGWDSLISKQILRPVLFLETFEALAQNFGYLSLSTKLASSKIFNQIDDYDYKM